MAKKKQSATRRIVKIIIGLIIVLVLLGIVGVATGMLGGAAEGVAVEVAEAERRDLTQVVTAFGRVQPEVEVTISPDVSGEIIELPVREGDRVEGGELLAAIQPDFYVAQAEQAEAGVAQAKAQQIGSEADVQQAQAELERQQMLYEREVVSQSDFELAETQYEVAQSRYQAAQYAVESAEAQLREAREQLSKTRIYAPMDGTVSMLNVELGERVVGTSQMAGTEMMRIARLDQMELEVDVNENDVVNVALRDSAGVEVDAYPDRAFGGVVMEIANSARVTGEGTQEQVTNFPVKVRLLAINRMAASGEASSGASGSGASGEDAGGVERTEMPTPAGAAPVFRPGMSGTVDIFTQTATGVIAVPIQAVTVRDFNRVQPDTAQADSAADESQGEPQAESQEAEREEAAPQGIGLREEDLRTVVFVVADDGTAQMVEVETGIADDTYIHVTSGLTGGETVIIGPYSAVSRELRPGMAVRVDERGPGLPVATAE